MRLLACLIVAPQRGYDEPAILSYAISSFCPTSADGLHYDDTSLVLVVGFFALVLPVTLFFVRLQFEDTGARGHI